GLRPARGAGPGPRLPRDDRHGAARAVAGGSRGRPPAAGGPAAPVGLLPRLRPRRLRVLPDGRGPDPIRAPPAARAAPRAAARRRPRAAVLPPARLRPRPGDGLPVRGGPGQPVPRPPAARVPGHLQLRRQVPAGGAGPRRAGPGPAARGRGVGGLPPALAPRAGGRRPAAGPRAGPAAAGLLPPARPGPG